MVVVGFAIVIITSRHALLRRCASRSWLVFASKHRHGSSRIGRCVYRGGQSLRQSWGRYCASLVGWIICLTVQDCLGEASKTILCRPNMRLVPCLITLTLSRFLSVALSGARFRCCPTRASNSSGPRRIRKHRTGCRRWIEQFATAQMMWVSEMLGTLTGFSGFCMILWILWENDDSPILGVSQLPLNLQTKPVDW